MSSSRNMRARPSSGHVICCYERKTFWKRTSAPGTKLPIWDVRQLVAIGGKADNICSMRVLRIFLSLDIILDPFGETVICLFLLVASRKNAKVCD